MTTVDPLRRLFQLNSFVLERNLAGVTQEESLRHPAEGGNCINWVLGHILTTRNAIHGLLGDEPLWPADRAARYARGSDAIRGAGAGVLPIAELVRDLDTSNARLSAAFERTTDGDLTRPSAESDASVGDMLVTLAFHEAYHAGQLGVLRRVAGKAGAIK